MKQAYFKAFNIVYYVWNIGLFIYAGMLFLHPHTFLAVLCFLAALFIATGLFFLPRFPKGRQRLSRRDVLIDVILVGVFLAVLIHGSYNLLFILFGISILLDIGLKLWIRKMAN